MAMWELKLYNNTIVNNTPPIMVSATFTSDTNMDIVVSKDLSSVNKTKLTSSQFSVTNAQIDTSNAKLVHITISGLSVADEGSGIATGSTGLQLESGTFVDTGLISSAKVSDNAISKDITKPVFILSIFVPTYSVNILLSKNIGSVDYTKITSTSFTISSASIDGSDKKLVHLTCSGISAADYTDGISSGSTGLQLASGAFTDLVSNSSGTYTNNAIRKLDTTKPTMISTSYFTSNTNMDLHTSESILYVDYTKMTSTKFTVTNATIDSTDNTLIHVTIAGLGSSDQIAGISGSSGLQLASGAFTDMSLNVSIAASNQTITADVTKPTRISAQFTTITNMDIVVSEALSSVDATKISSSKFSVTTASIDTTTKTLIHVTISGLSYLDYGSGISAGSNGLRLSSGAFTDYATRTSISDFNNAIATIWENDYYSDGNIVTFPPSTIELNDKLVSGMKFVELYDGDEAVIIPPITNRKDNVSFELSPLRITDEMMVKFNGYITNYIGLRITDHTGRIFEGYFIAINKKYMLSGKSQLYTVEIEMHLFDVDGSGSY